MVNSSLTKKAKSLKRFICQSMAWMLSLSLIFPPSLCLAQGLPDSIVTLPNPGTMVKPSEEFSPAIIHGLTIHPDNPLLFDFIVDTGDGNLQGEDLKNKGMTLVKYFLASLTVPENQMWVNLSPYEKEHTIPETLAQTDMGKDLLSQDYLLKQLTATLMYPEEDLGQEFWQRVFQKAQDKYGTTNIPINTFNKVWVVADKATVWEHHHSAFVLDRHLKVMLEEDYLTLEENLGKKEFGTDRMTQGDVEALSGLSADVVREILIPEIEKEINEGKNFAQLRQIFNSMILATWYKKTLRDGLLGQVYVDRNKTKGIDIDGEMAREKIYDQYIEAFKKGVYDYIREDVDEPSQKSIKRKYFSGGIAPGVVLRAENLTVLRGEHPDHTRFQAMETPSANGEFADLRVSLIENADNGLAQRNQGSAESRDLSDSQETLFSVTGVDALIVLLKLIARIVESKGFPGAVAGLDSEEAIQYAADTLHVAHRENPLHVREKLQDFLKLNPLQSRKVLDSVVAELSSNPQSYSDDFTIEQVKEFFRINLLEQNGYDIGMRLRYHNYRSSVDEDGRSIIDQIEFPEKVHAAWLDVNLRRDDGTWLGWVRGIAGWAAGLFSQQWAQRITTYQTSLLAVRSRNNTIGGPAKGGIREVWASDLYDPVYEPEFVEAWDELNEAQDAGEADFRHLLYVWMIGEANPLSLGMTGKTAFQWHGGGKGDRFLGELFLGNDGKWKIRDLPAYAHSSYNKALIDRAYSRELARNDMIGPDIDIPAPDKRTGGRNMIIMLDEYGRFLGEERPDAILDPVLRQTILSILQRYGGHYPVADFPIAKAMAHRWQDDSGQINPVPEFGVFTGLPGMIDGVSLGGVGLKRGPATGDGGVDVTRGYYQTIGESLAGKRISIHGSGNAALYGALRYIREGAIVDLISNRQVALLKEEGWSEQEILAMIDQFERQGRRLNDMEFEGQLFRERVGVVPYTGKEEILAQVFLRNVDIIVAAATENVITPYYAERIQAPLIVELANGPTTNEAARILHQREIVVLHDTLANAGGVTVSNLGVLQAVLGKRFTAQQVEMLRNMILLKELRATQDVFQRFNGQYPFQWAFDLAGIEQLKSKKRRNELIRARGTEIDRLAMLRYDGLKLLKDAEEIIQQAQAIQDAQARGQEGAEIYPAEQGQLTVEDIIHLGGILTDSSGSLLEDAVMLTEDERERLVAADSELFPESDEEQLTAALPGPAILMAAAFMTNVLMNSGFLHSFGDSRVRVNPAVLTGSSGAIIPGAAVGEAVVVSRQIDRAGREVSQVHIEGESSPYQVVRERTADDWTVSEISFGDEKEYFVDGTFSRRTSSLLDISAERRSDVVDRQANNIGGIDLSSKFLDLQIKRNGRGVPLPLEHQPVATMNIEGFAPVLIHLAPINLPMFLGQSEQTKPADLTRPLT